MGFIIRLCVTFLVDYKHKLCYIKYMKMNFKENLKRLRIENNLMQKDVARGVGYSERTVSGWETGEREPTLQGLQAICNFFNIDYNELLDE